MRHIASIITATMEAGAPLWLGTTPPREPRGGRLVSRQILDSGPLREEAGSPAHSHKAYGENSFGVASLTLDKHLKNY